MPVWGGVRPGYVCFLLDRLGLSYQKGRFTSDHLNAEAALLWLEETWSTIVRAAKGKQAVILFGDVASFAQWGKLSYTWALKGIQPTVMMSGIRKAYRVFGLLDCFVGALYQRGLEGKFNSETYADFLVWTLTQVKGQPIVIQDNAAYHTSAPMRAFYAANTDRLTVYQLLPYSPDLNPIERLWQPFRHDVTHNHRRDTLYDVHLDAYNHFLRLDDEPNTVLRQIGSPFAQSHQAAA